MRYTFLPVVFLLAALSAVAQNSPRVLPGIPDPPLIRSAGTMFPHVAGGSSNGMRVGLWGYVAPILSLEASFGYIQLTNKNISAPNEAEVKADGKSASFGLNLVTHPRNDLSPLLTVLVSYNWAHDDIYNIDMTRYVLTIAFGSVWNLTRHFALFFRTGPSIHFLSEREAGDVQMLMQFDGGVGWTF
jgi:hypothetical protein